MDDTLTESNREEKVRDTFVEVSPRTGREQICYRDQCVDYQLETGKVLTSTVTLRGSFSAQTSIVNGRVFGTN